MFCYVYMLRSIADPSRHYVGFTEDLRTRLAKHNAGSVPHTAKYLPWRIETAGAFSDRTRAPPRVKDSAMGFLAVPDGTGGSPSGIPTGFRPPAASSAAGGAT